MEKTDLIKTLNGVSLFFLLLFLIFGKKWLLIISAIFLLLTIFGGRFTFFLAEGWIKLGQFIGTALTKIFLTLVFYLFVTPLGFFYRIFNREVYLFFKEKKRDTFFKDVNMEYKKEDFEKLW